MTAPLGSAQERRRALLRELLSREGLPAPQQQGIARSEETSWAPLSFSQRWLWLFQRTFDGTAAYNVPFAVRLTGQLDTDAVAHALNRAVERHEILRTTYASDPQPRQLVQPPVRLPVPLHDVQALPAHARERAAKEHLSRLAGLPFDLEHGPVLRAELVRLAADDHMFACVVHHIAADALSAGVLMDELITAYAAIIAGEEAAAAPLPIQYRDYARWQLDQLEDRSALERHLGFWQEYLADAPPALSLPLAAGRARPDVPRLRGDTVTFDVPATLVCELRQFSRAAEATPFVAWLAVFYILLYRYTGETDIIVGTPIANRNEPNLASLIGVFVNTLPIRATLSPGYTFRTLTQEVRRQTLAALGHQDIPFEKIVEVLNPARSLSSNAYFQMLLSYRLAIKSHAHEPFRVEEVTLNNNTSKRDLTVHMREDGERLTVTLEYDQDLFDAARIGQLREHFLQLAAAAAQAPDTPVSRLSMLTEQETAACRSYNATTATFAQSHRTLHEIVERQAAQTPRARAVVQAGDAVSYAELNERANQLAHYLAGLGVGSEARVGLCLDRSVEMVVAVLGVLKAGGAYLPLDPHGPDDRRRTMMTDAGAKVLITASERDAGWAAGRHMVVVLDRAWRVIADQPCGNPPARSGPANVAYLLYTSGSTGKPKGVVIEHRNVTNYTFAFLRAVGITDPIRYAVTQPLIVDSVVTQICCALCTGGELHLIDRPIALDAARLAQYCTENSIDLLKAAPSHLRALERSTAFAGLLPRRHLIVGGEASGWDWLRDLQGRAGDCTVYNHYGPTETTVGTMVLNVRDHLRAQAVSAPIGPPIANCHAYVLDENWELVPVGVAGELCVGGAGVGRGYHARPDLTAASFVPDPFSGRPGARLYRSGDIVRAREDGTFDFVGRRDEQVKIRGFRVELGDIAAAVKSHPGVRDAFVAVTADAGGSQLVAYVVPGDGTESLPDGLRATLAARLPGHMVPDLMMPLPALPLSQHGKVDRQALPLPTPGGGPASPAGARPSELEQLIESTWRRVLGVDRVDPQENFFEVGGHSLLVIQLHNELQQSLEREFDLIELFQHTTIRAQASYLAQRPGSSAADRGREQGGEQGRRQGEQLRQRQRVRQQERGRRG